MDDVVEVPSATRTLTRILVPVGAVMVLFSMGGFEPLPAFLFTAVTMVLWTALLPRLSVLRPMAPYFASHALATGAFWAVLGAADRWWIMVGSEPDQMRMLLVSMVSAVACGIVGLLAGIALHRAVLRGGERLRRGLATTAASLLIATPLLCVAAQGQAPMSFERLHDVPVVAHLSPEARDASEPLALLRWPDGSFDVGPPGSVEALVAGGPNTTARRCTVIPRGVGIEVRRLEGAVLYSAEHALDMDSTFVTGCAFDAVTLSPREILVRDLPRPVSTGMRYTAVVVAAFVAALVHLVLAALVCRRAARLASAKEGVADGTGRVVLADGTELRCRAAAGPVLVEPHATALRGYRDDAADTASLLARGTRAATELELHASECTAWVGAIATLGCAALTVTGAVIGGLVIPL